MDMTTSHWPIEGARTGGDEGQDTREPEKNKHQSCLLKFNQAFPQAQGEHEVSETCGDKRRGFCFGWESGI